MWAPRARAPWKTERTQHQPQSRNIPAPSRSAHAYTHCLSLVGGRSGPLVTSRNGTRRTRTGGPGLRVFPSQGRRPHLSICGWSGGSQVPWAMSSDLFHSGQWPQPVPPSPDTWFCSCVDVACCSLSRTASLSRRATSSSCSWAFSSRSWDMASTILCTTGAAPGDPDRLEHLPLPKGRPPMSKVAADQRGSRGPSLAEDRGPIMAGWTTGTGSGCKQSRQGSWATAGAAAGVRGCRWVSGGAASRACLGGSRFSGKLLVGRTAWARSQESNFHSLLSHSLCSRFDGQYPLHGQPAGTCS